MPVEDVKLGISQQVIHALPWTPKHSVIKLAQSFQAWVGTPRTKEGRLPWQMSVPGYNKFGLIVVTLGLFEEARGIPGKGIV